MYWKSWWPCQSFKCSEITRLAKRGQIGEIQSFWHRILCFSSNRWWFEWFLLDYPSPSWTRNAVRTPLEIPQKPPSQWFWHRNSHESWKQQFLMKMEAENIDCSDEFYQNSIILTEWTTASWPWWRRCSSAREAYDFACEWCGLVIRYLCSQLRKRFSFDIVPKKVDFHLVRQRYILFEINKKCF